MADTRSRHPRDPEHDGLAQRNDPDNEALEGTYQTMGAGGLDVSDRGAATAGSAQTGGKIGIRIGGERSTGGMPMGMGIGSDIGTVGTTGARGTGTFAPGRSGDIAEASMSESGEAPNRSAVSSGGSVGGGAATTGGAAAPPDPTPERREDDGRRT